MDDALDRTAVLSRSGPPWARPTLVAVVRAARAAGRSVPGDLAVTGWDDAPVAGRLDLTTVAQSLREQGAACAHAALGRRPDSFAAAWSVVRRGSTRPS